MIKNYIIVGFISILVAISIILSIKCNKLEDQILEFKAQSTIVVDSIAVENQKLEIRIQHLNSDLLYYKQKIDSLNNVKQKIIIQTEYIVSENLIEGTQLLKENLRWERYL